MRRGGLVQVGTPLEIYQNPVDDEVVHLFGEPNEWLTTAGNGVAATPFGAVPCDPSLSGAVQVCVRAEAFALAEHETEGTLVEVARHRLLGSDWLIDFRLAESGETGQARLSAFDGAGSPDAIRLVMDARKAYVFPAP